MTVLNLSPLQLSPDILLCAAEHNQLTPLALAGSGHSPDAADDLNHELERARVVADPELTSDVVRMGSLVKFRTGRDERSVVLAYPADADIAERRISVLTPIGTALIGLRAGQSISFRTRDGRPQMLTVLAVAPPQDGGDDDDPGPMAA